MNYSATFFVHLKEIQQTDSEREKITLMVKNGNFEGEAPCGEGKGFGAVL